MAFKSKDVIKVTELGRSVKDTLPLLEYRLVKNLDQPMLVNQIYKKIIDSYPEDYLEGSFEFYKIIELLGSKKIIEKIIIEKEEGKEFNDLFENEDMVDMSTIATDDVDFIIGEEKERKLLRRKDRWFFMNKNNFNEENEGLEIKVTNSKKLNYRHISKIEDKENINIPIENPFYMTEAEIEEERQSREKLIKEEKMLKKERKTEIQNMSFTFDDKQVNDEKHKNTELREANKKARRGTREARTKFNEKIKKEQLSKKKYKKLREETNVVKLFIEGVIKRIREIIKK